MHSKTSLGCDNSFEKKNLFRPVAIFFFEIVKTAEVVEILSIEKNTCFTAYKYIVRHIRLSESLFPVSAVIDLLAIYRK